MTMHRRDLAHARRIENRPFTQNIHIPKSAVVNLCEHGNTRTDWKICCPDMKVKRQQRNWTSPPKRPRATGGYPPPTK